MTTQGPDPGADASAKVAPETLTLEAANRVFVELYSDADSRDGDPGSAWLHVSAGVGTSPYARIRVACRPEATLMTLVPRA